MVRKIVMSVLVLGLLLLATPSRAFAYDVYDSGNISNTYTEIFKDIIEGLPTNDDYVYFRSGQYSYTLLVGDFDYNNKKFTGNEYTDYTITTNNTSYNNVYNYSVTTGNNLTFNVGNLLVYSNLGNYPTLLERGSTYEFALVFVSVVFGLCALIRPIFKFVQRNSTSRRTDFDS